jgi:hypothetical protein
MKQSKKFKWYLLVSITVALIAIPLGNFVIDLLNKAICDNTIKYELLLPSNNYVVYSYSRNCGATSDEFYNVSVYPKEQGFPPRRGNIAYADKPLKVTWLNYKQVEINYERNTHFYKKETKFKDINIMYKQS